MSGVAADACDTRSAHFSIDGEWLTDICRSLVLEGRWRHALKTLVEGLHGMSTDQALSILRGEQWLCGVNTVEMLEDDRTEAANYVADLAWQYAGLWNWPTKGLWQPYAFVGALSKDDLPRMSLFPRVDPAAMPEWESRRELDRWTYQRFLYYADEPELDFATVEPVPDGPRGPVLWRFIPDPPMWMTGCSSSAEALADFYHHDRRLEERGPHVHGSPLLPGEQDVMVPDYGAIARLGPDDPTPPLQPLANVSHADRIASQLGFTGRMADAVHAIFDPVDKRPPEPDHDLAAESGYILPDGAFYGCPYMHHPKLALRILKHLFKVEAEDPQKEADRRNWLRIQARVTGGFTIMSPKGRPTKRQEKTLADWCIKHEVPYPEDLK